MRPEERIQGWASGPQVSSSILRTTLGHCIGNRSVQPSDAHRASPRRPRGQHPHSRSRMCWLSELKASEGAPAVSWAMSSSEPIRRPTIGRQFVCVLSIAVTVRNSSVCTCLSARVHVDYIAHVGRPLEFAHDRVELRSAAMKSKTPIGGGEDPHTTEGIRLPERGILADQTTGVQCRCAHAQSVR